MDFLAHKTPSYVKQNCDESHSTQTKIHRKFKIHYQPVVFLNLKKKNSLTKRLKTFAKCCDFQKENHTLGYGYKNLQKIFSLAYGFLFFVISISGHVICMATHIYIIHTYTGIVESLHKFCIDFDKKFWG
jgi:hypothetical protein